MSVKKVVTLALESLIDNRVTHDVSEKILYFFGGPFTDLDVVSYHLTKLWLLKSDHHVSVGTLWLVSRILLDVSNGDFETVEESLKHNTEEGTWGEETEIMLSEIVADKSILTNLKEVLKEFEGEPTFMDWLKSERKWFREDELSDES